MTVRLLRALRHALLRFVPFAQAADHIQGGDSRQNPSALDFRSGGCKDRRMLELLIVLARAAVGVPRLSGIGVGHQRSDHPCWCDVGFVDGVQSRFLRETCAYAAWHGLVTETPDGRAIRRVAWTTHVHRSGSLSDRLSNRSPADHPEMNTRRRRITRVSSWLRGRTQAPFSSPPACIAEDDYPGGHTAIRVRAGSHSSAGKKDDGTAIGH